MNIFDILTFFAVIAGIVGIPWYLGRRSSRVENKITHLCTSHNSLSNLMGTVINILFKKNLVEADDRTAITSEQVKMQHVEGIKPNPLTDEELDKLSKVITKAIDSVALNEDEVQAFVEIIETLQDEKPNDPLTWRLSSVAAYLAGAYLNLKSENDSPKAKAVS